MNNMDNMNNYNNINHADNIGREIRKLPKEIINIIFGKYWKIKRKMRFEFYIYLLLDKRVIISERFINNGISFLQILRNAIFQNFKEDFLQFSKHCHNNPDKALDFLQHNCGCTIMSAALSLYVSDFDITLAAARLIDVEIEPNVNPNSDPVSYYLKMEKNFVLSILENKMMENIL